MTRLRRRELRGSRWCSRGAPGGPAPHRRGGGAHQDDRAPRGCPCGGRAARVPHPCPESPDGRPAGAHLLHGGRRLPAPARAPSGGRLWVGPGSLAPSRTLRLFSPHTLRAAVSRHPGWPVTGAPDSRAVFPCPSPLGRQPDPLFLVRWSHVAGFPGSSFLTPTLLPGASWATGSGPQTSERPTPEVEGPVLGSRPGPPAAVAATHHQGALGMRLPGRGIRGGIRGGVRGWVRGGVRGGVRGWAQSWLFSRMCLRACSWEVGSALPEAQVVGTPVTPRPAEWGAGLGRGVPGPPPALFLSST